MKNDSYMPISCIFYDHLESLATIKKTVNIKYRDDFENQLSSRGKIIDFEVNNKIEYLLLDNGISIRLDKLVSVENLHLEDFTNCEKP